MRPFILLMLLVGGCHSLSASSVCSDLVSSDTTLEKKEAACRGDAGESFAVAPEDTSQCVEALAHCDAQNLQVVDDVIDCLDNAPACTPTTLGTFLSAVELCAAPLESDAGRPQRQLRRFERAGVFGHIERWTRRGRPEREMDGHRCLRRGCRDLILEVTTTSAFGANQSFSYTSSFQGMLATNSIPASTLVSLSVGQASYSQGMGFGSFSSLALTSVEEEAGYAGGEIYKVHGSAAVSLVPLSTAYEGEQQNLSEDFVLMRRWEGEAQRPGTAEVPGLHVGCRARI